MHSSLQDVFTFLPTCHFKEVFKSYLTPVLPRLIFLPVNETVVFEPAGDHGIFLPPGTGFLLISFTAFLIQVCSNIASVVNPREFGGRRSKVSVNVLELGLAGWNVPVCDCSCSECFLGRCLGFFPSPDKICLVFSNYGYVVGMIQSVN